MRSCEISKKNKQIKTKYKALTEHHIQAYNKQLLDSSRIN